MTDTYNFVVSDRVSMKVESDGSVAQTFTLWARSSNNKVYPKVDRTYRDFKSLEVAMNNNLRSNDVECPQLERESMILDLSGRGAKENDIPISEKLQNIRKFLKELSSDPALHIEPFYDFFNIPKPEFHAEARLSEVDISEKLRATYKPENHATESGTWADYEKQTSVDYCGYFKVAIYGAANEREDRADPGKSMHHYYSFVIKPLAGDESTLNIEKRYSDFLDLAARMKGSVKARPPPIPAKLIVKDKNSLQKRGEGLEEWLTVVLNEKIFFCADVFEFIGLNSRSLVRYSELDIIGALQDAVIIKLAITDKKSAQNSEESFVLWEIQVLVLNPITKDRVDAYKVFRRFKEFDNLNNELRHKFQKNVKQLPELPGKLMNMLSREHRDQRREKLDSYLTKLADYPNIFQAICFRKFIELESRKVDELLSRSGSPSNR